jgi:acyl carrier protein
MQPTAIATDAQLERDVILQKLQELLRTSLMLESTVALSAETRFQEDLHADSLGMVDVIIAVEEGFGIKLQSDLNFFETIRTVGDAVELIQSQLGPQGAPGETA